MSDQRQRPSIVWGVRTAARMWALVLVVWLSGLAFFVPASIVLHRAAVDALGHVPDDFDLPVGDGAILVFGLVRDVADTLIVGLVFAVILSWAWTVLWHAGVAQVSVWDPEGAVVIYDAATLEEVKRIPMNKPSGKYNVYNKITRSAGPSH